MKRLAIETATRVCSVALAIDGEVIRRSGDDPRMHATVLLPWIAELLAEAGIGYRDLDALAVDRGPGGFTSLRIGLGVAQGIALAHDLPCYPVSCLAAMAYVAGVPDVDQRAIVLLDARMDEVYTCAYSFDRVGQPVALVAEQLLAPEAVEPPADGPFVAVGDGLTRYGERLDPQMGANCTRRMPDGMPTAVALLALATAVTPIQAHELAPVYLRDRVTH
ncbi:MAG: tRNA (adenosine(37)-N6)-threonylcarbamoyltransferase complex dimerization subunit type 1 TsaB [Wenzhouxiangellaceae bacterium]|nr:tRNA (adenosine(37)-N6)-threonylcarbamoyltransferase complex dimerization subunit type 1 TsaB [Wenzhouxiangellaceae bacterium]